MITQQDIRLLKNTLNNLHSWIDVLEPMKEFFTMTSEQINKRKIVREFYAHSQVFLTFYESYLNNISLLENKIIVLE